MCEVTENRFISDFLFWKRNMLAFRSPLNFLFKDGKLL